MSIDNNDYNLQYEAKYYSLKKLISEELIGLNQDLAEVGFNYSDEITNINEEVLLNYFHNVRKAIQSLKLRVNQIESTKSIIIISDLFTY
jgi:hypothetical protein